MVLNPPLSRAKPVRNGPHRHHTIIPEHHQIIPMVVWVTIIIVGTQMAKAEHGVILRILMNAGITVMLVNLAMLTFAQVQLVYSFSRHAF